MTAHISNEKNKSPESADSTLIFGLESLSTSDTFRNWPLHLTLQRWFDVPENRRRAFINAMTNYTYELDAIVARGGDLAQFDENGETLVRRVIGNGALHIVHQQTADLIRRFGGTPSTQWSGSEYAPHVTFQGDAGLGEDEALSLRTLHLVRRDEAFVKTIEATFYLRKGERGAPTAR